MMTDIRSIDAYNNFTPTIGDFFFLMRNEKMLFIFKASIVQPVVSLTPPGDRALLSLNSLFFQIGKTRFSFRSNICQNKLLAPFASFTRCHHHRYRYTPHYCCPLNLLFCLFWLFSPCVLSFPESIGMYVVRLY